MHELRKIFPYSLKDRIGDEFINTLMLLLNFVKFWKNSKVVPLLLPQQFLNNLHHMVNANSKDAPNFIRISISSIKKSYLKITHELLSIKLCDSLPDFIFSMYYHQAIDLIESNVCELLPPKLKTKSPQNMCSIFFENKGVEFINIARILRDPDTVKSFP